MATARHPLLEALAPQAEKFGGALAEDAHAKGFWVTEKNGDRKPLPLSALPVVLPADEIRRRSRAAAALCRAALKMAKAVLAGPSADLLLGCFSPLERSILLPHAEALRAIPHCRIDFFAAERPTALEVNATIPALTGYSDMAASAFIETVGARAGLPPEERARLSGRNGSNVIALYRALLRAFETVRGGAPTRIALLARRNDSQMGELQYMADRFGELGTEAEVVHPDELSGEGAVEAHGRAFDLIHRHLFVRRLDETPAPYLTALLKRPDDPRALVLNPPDAQVESKLTFAFLSESLEAPGLAEAAGLDDEERAAIAEHVPWTRPLRSAPGTLPDGTPTNDLAAAIAESPERFVLKRAWDYGGKSVFVGAEAKSEGFQAKVRATYGRPLAWPDLCQRASEDRLGGGFIAQEHVRPTEEQHFLATPEAVRKVQLFVDYSAYASVGIEAPSWGGVCRGSPTRIVNIAGGGGILPLITSEVADALWEGIQRRAER